MMNGKASRMQIGLQLYTLRDVPDPLPEVLRKVAELGYEGVEFAGFGGLEAHEVKALLTELNLVAIASHTNYDELCERLDEVIAYHQTIGAHYIICPYLPEALRDTRETSLRTAETLRKIGGKIASHGLQFGYHNHWFEFDCVFDGQRLFDLLLCDASPDELNAELDVCWVQRGGQDPLAYLSEYQARTPLIHIKDMVTDGGGDVTTVPLGAGVMNLDAVVAAAQDADVTWLVVEQDECQGNPYENVARSRIWLNEHYEAVSPR